MCTLPLLVAAAKAPFSPCTHNLDGMAVMYSALCSRPSWRPVAEQYRSTPRFMLPTAMKSLPGPHTARNGVIQRPVWLSCFMLSAGSIFFSPDSTLHTRKVSSYDVVKIL